MAEQSPEFDLKQFLKNLTEGPGVYRMLGLADKVLYVGKAKNLKRRVSSYFNKSQKSAKNARMLTFMKRIEVTLTHTENEALLLEFNLIKQHQPPFNVMLRDDKSYPYIFVSTAHQYPQIRFHRGAQKSKGRYFGPYPSAAAAREAMTYIQRLFQIRPCDDTYFKNRSRACLQHQIKRCSGPCVEAVEEQQYQRDVDYAVKFLEGKNSAIADSLSEQMMAASEAMEYEKAATLRDQLKALRKVEETQNISSDGGDSDVVVCQVAAGQFIVVVWFVRGGRQLGHKALFPKASDDWEPSEVLTDVLSQYYVGKPIPKDIICNVEPDDQETLQSALSDQAGRKVALKAKVVGQRRKWLQMAELTASQALTHRLASDAKMRQRFEDLQQRLALDFVPERIECFDISHSHGEDTVASCVVFDQNGARKNDYRRFNIDGITGGDDYAAMKQAITRRYQRLKSEGENLPDILLIDGGKGQLSQAQQVLEELQITEITTVGVAKGTTRKPGLEQLFLEPTGVGIAMPDDSLALHLIQQVRDEAHRFAITGHRNRRDKKRSQSKLEEIAGLGPKRRQKLLLYFGGAKQVANAGVEELTKVPGISADLAQKIYDYLH